MWIFGIQRKVFAMKDVAHLDLLIISGKLLHFFLSIKGMQFETIFFGISIKLNISFF